VKCPLPIARERVILGKKIDIAYTAARKKQQLDYRANRRLKGKIRLAKMFRRRARKRSLERNPNAQKKHTDVDGKKRYAQDTELSIMLRMAGLTWTQFAALVNINRNSVYNWQGAPARKWPTTFMRLYLYAKNMERAFVERGVDTEQFKPVITQEFLKDGRYPRGRPTIIGRPFVRKYPPKQTLPQPTQDTPQDGLLPKRKRGRPRKVPQLVEP
jgi:hypothetical protein